VKSAKAATRPPKKSGAEWRAEARARDASLAQAFERLKTQHGLPESDADLIAEDHETVTFFERALDGTGAAPQSVARWIVNELPRLEREVSELLPNAQRFGRLVKQVDDGALERAAAKDLLPRVVIDGEEPGARAGLGDDEVAALLDEVLARNPDKVAQYKGGKTGLLGFFVGQVVKASSGKASPQLVQKLVAEKLS
jgi:Asp-tRNA(Asn)/Glu-tRNA(Gln) amidotransferase B subunit